MAVALLRSGGCQAAVRGESAILPPRGLGKAQKVRNVPPRGGPRAGNGSVD